VAKKMMKLFDDSYLKKQEAILRPAVGPILQEQVDKQGRPSLVVLDMASQFIHSQEREDPRQPKLTELQKGQLALKYVQMNANPKKYGYYKRFISNRGDVEVPGFDPITGRPFEVTRKTQQADGTLYDLGMETEMP